MRDEAKKLRDLGVTYAKIAGLLGVSQTTVYRWLNPEKFKTTMSRYVTGNKDKVSARRKDYRAKNSEMLSEYQREYRKENRGRIAAQKRLRRKTDTQFRLSESLRTRLGSAIKGGYKAGSAVSDLGCSVEDLKRRLEFCFEPGMAWDNYGEWHIDHIRPLASFDLTDRDQFLQACNFTNLQPMWAEDNLRKGDRCEGLKRY